MYKVMIVDDEAVIVEGLAKVVPWSRYDCQVVASAYDVAQATARIRELHPHILFTDIRMPDGDGLTMLAGLKSEHPEMQVTVLTGYRDFKYAQEAIRLGVSRFLLKPSKMDELEEALSVMTEKLRKLDIHPTPAQEQADEAASFVVRQAVKYIEDHSAEKIALSDVADAVFVSQWHLSKLLNRYTGQNFYDILNAARIEKAKELMQNPSLRIGDIAAMVGYTDPPHFSRVFKKLEGISAGEYRNERLK